jgi:hypothetical protein
VRDIGIIARYTFEEGSGTIIDQSGNGNDLTNTSLTYDNTDAKEGTYSIVSNARSDRGIAATDFFPPLGDFSFCMWFKLTNTSALNPDYFASRAGGALGTVPGVCIGTNGPTGPHHFGICLDDGIGNAYTIYFSSFFHTLGAWYDAVLTVQRDPQVVKIYKQGIDITGTCTVERTGTGNLAGHSIAGSPVVLNNRPNLSDRGVIGKYDDVRLYDGVLTPQEVLDYHNKVLPA